MHRKINLAARWRALFYVYLSMLAFSFVFQVIPPVLGQIVSSLKISHAQAGALMSAFALPGLFISIPGGLLTDRYGPKRVSLTALFIAAAGSLLVGLGNSYALLAAGRVITGTGAGILAVVTSQTVSRWFAGKELGSAMGLYNTAMPIGTIFALNIFSRIAAATNWRLPILLTAGYALFIALLYYFKHPGLPRVKGAPETRESSGSGKIGGAVWLVALIWMLFNAAAISYLTFSGDYFITKGYEPGYAGFLASLFMIGSFLFSPLVGYLTDRWGRDEYFVIGGSAVLALLLLLVARSALNPLLLGSLIGLSAAFIPAPVFSLIPKVVPPGQLGLGYGILSTCLNIGVLVGPFLVGLSHDQSGDYVFGFHLMALFSLAAVAAVLVLLFSRTRKYGMTARGE
jgi:predicted MFS family arabinose efflux permease